MIRYIKKLLDYDLARTFNSTLLGLVVMLVRNLGLRPRLFILKPVGLSKQTDRFLWSNIITTITIIALVGVFASCQKQDATVPDLSKVTVTYNTPINRLTFHKGDTVNIDANIGYTNEINGVMVQIIDSAADQVIFQDDQDLHTDKFRLQRTWVDTYANNARLKVVITTAIANGTKFAENNIYFYTQP